MSERSAVSRESMIGASSESPVPRLVRLSEMMDELRMDAAAAHQALTEGRPRGPVTGLPKLDAGLGGRLAAGFNVLHGGPGVGKTAWALQVAATCQFPALYVSCEMSCLELFRRIIARTTCTSLDFIRAGTLNPGQVMDKAKQAIAAAPNLALLDATQSFAGPELLLAAAEQVRGSDRHLLLVIDSIHSWADSVPGDAEEYVALNAALAALRTLARRLDCPIIGIAERNRMSMRSGGISAGAGSRKIEYGAELIVELDQEEGAARNGAGEAPVRLKVSKNRNGSKGQTISLLWHDAYQRFRET